MQQSDQKIQDGRHDFDFFTGTWKVYHRRLKERLNGSQAWEEFEGLAHAQTILGGLGNFDTLTMLRESGTFHGMTVRLFDVKSQEWSLYWADGSSGTITLPMIGKFENGLGYFYALDTHADKHIFSRFVWSDISETTCHWEQAFSDDGGVTWETNWTMKFVKAG